MSLSEATPEEAAVQAYAAGQTARAEALCREALTRDPADYRSLVLFAALLRERGATEESLRTAEHAVRLRPGIVEAYFQVALSASALGRPEVAVSALRIAIRLRPEIPVFHLHAGLALAQIGERAAARREFEECLRGDPNQLQARLCLVADLLLDDKVDEAKAHAELALRIAPKSVAAHLSMADVHEADNDPQKAAEWVEGALALDPNSAVGLTMRGFRLSQAGRFTEADENFRRAIDRDPAQGLAYLGLSQSRKFSEADRDLVARMETIRDGSALPPSEASSLQFALAKAYGELGDYERSMRAYDTAQSLAARARFGGRTFDYKTYEAGIESIRRIFSDTRPMQTAIDNETPILIVGMIRSGTTLAEQILSRHPYVGAAGEHPFWKKLAGNSDRLVQLSDDPSAARQAANDYVESLCRCAPGYERVTDKLPGNYLRLGLIHEILPRAKIIHCRRRPLDTAFSIYTTPNRVAPSFSHWQEAIVFAYRQYQALMDHWRGVLPSSQFLEIDYEDLVAAPEPEIARMLEFCELEWEDACLHPEENEKPVATPSVWQVRQPIYRSSVEKWRPYQPWLGALLELRDV